MNLLLNAPMENSKDRFQYVLLAEEANFDLIIAQEYINVLAIWMMMFSLIVESHSL